MSEDAGELIWAIRFTRRARANVQEVWEYFAETVGEERADSWQEGLEEAVATLARLPFRCPIAPESKFFGPPDVRRLLYRQTRGGTAYHILFRIFAMDEASLDARFVRIIAIRPAVVNPLTEDEAKLIERAET